MKDVYNRIIRAYKRGQGIRLTAMDVHALAQDDAIAHRASVLRGEQRGAFITWEEQCAGYAARAALSGDANAEREGNRCR